MPISLGVHSGRLGTVRGLLTKRGRRTSGAFTFEGPTMLGEALASGVEPDEVYATKAAWDDLGPQAAALTCPVYLISEDSLARISDLEAPPGIVAVGRQRLEPAAQLLADGRPVLLLAGVADPGNAGSLMRSAEAFGIERVLFGVDGVGPYNPKVVRGSMGAIFRLRFGVVSRDELPHAARASGHVIVSADRGGTPLDAFGFVDRTILAIGSERHGTREWVAAPDAVVGIPHVGRGESLNAAVAGAIVLYEFARRGHVGDTLSRPNKP